MKTYIHYIIGIVLFGMTVAPVAAQNGSELLDNAAKAYEKANGISASFALHTRAEGISESFEGVIQMKGDKFTFATPDIHVWYDGKTQWTYMERNQEVNVTEPTGDELQSVNPAFLLNSYKKGYTVAYKGESTASNGKTAYDIELTPKKKGDVIKVILQLEKNSSFPSRITIEAKNGSRTTIQIDKLTTAMNQPDDFFVFNKRDYPNVDVFDLRD